MANDDNPRGLIPLNLGRPAEVHFYRASSGTDIYVGCPVYLAPTGYVTIASPTGVVPILGVALGFAGVGKAGLASNKPFFDVSDVTPPAAELGSGDRWVAVADNPDQLFVAQEDTGGTALALADVGAAIDFVYRGGTTPNGNDTTGWANIEIDASQVVTTTAAAAVIMGLVDSVNSDGTPNAVGDYAKWIIRILNHQKRGGTTGTVV